MIAVYVLVFLTIVFWSTPIVLFLAGIFKLKKDPERAKMLLIISGIWLTVGLSFCGIAMYN